MPVYKIRGPDGKLYRYRVDAENVGQEDVLKSFNQQFSIRSALSAFEPPKKQAGFTGAFKDAVTSLGLADEAAAYAANPTEENRQEFLKKAESKYKSVGGFGKGNNWEAFKELLGGSLGALVAPIGAGIIGGGIPGFAAASAAQYGVQNLRRQAEEQQAAAEAGEPVPELSLGKAATAAGSQAALDIVPGALILKGLSKFPVAQRLLTKDATSSKAAQVLIDAFNKGNLSLKGNIVKGVGLGVAFEVPQEIAQQALERWQAGLPLDDDEAKEEFKQAAIGAALLGGGFGAIGGAATYRGVQAEKAKAAAEQERERTEIEQSIFGEQLPADVGIPADFYAADEERRGRELEESIFGAIPTETGIPADMLETEAQREARLEREAIQAEGELGAAPPAVEERRPYSARTLQEAAEAEALAPREEDEVAPYIPSARGEEERVIPTPSRTPEEEAELTEDMFADAREYDAERAATAGVMEGLGAPAEGGIPAEMFEVPAVTPVEPATPAPRDIALEVIKTTPTIKAVAEATGLNQPQAAAIVRQFVDEGILERKGNKFVLAAPPSAAQPEATDVSSATAATTETDSGAGGRSPDLFTLGPSAGELGAPPTRGAGLAATGDVTERVDDREADVSPTLEADLESLGLEGAPTETGLPLRKLEGYLAERQKVRDLKDRAVAFIRETGKGAATELQAALGIPLSQAKALRNALLGSGQVVQKTNVKAAKTAGRSYFVVEGDYTPSGKFAPREAAVTEARQEPVAETGLEDLGLEGAPAETGLPPEMLDSYFAEQRLEEARQRATGKLRGEGVESETERIQRQADKAAEITDAIPRELPPTLKPEIGKGEYGLRYKDAQGNTVYRAYESTGQRSEARANLAKEGNKDFGTFSRMAEIAKFELDYMKRQALPAMTKPQVQRAVQNIKAGMSKLKTQLGLFTEEEAPTPKKAVPKRVSRKEVVDYAKNVITLARDSGKLKKYAKRIQGVLDSVQRGDTDLRTDYKTLQRIEDSITKAEAQLGEATQARLEEDIDTDVRDTVDDEVSVKGRDEDEYKPLDFRKVRFKKKNPQIFTDKFKSWFRKSKIVDDVGDAATWYIGSPVTDIEAFRIGTADAIYASPEPNVANQFTFNRETLGEGVVYPVFIRAENPFDFANPTHVENLFKKMLENAGGNTGFISSILNLRRRIEEGSWQELEMPVVQRAIKALGHDGFYVYENRAKNIGVYDPNQIKSALGNTGAFSQYDPRIRFSKKKSLTKGLKADTVRSLIGKITAGWKNPPNFIVVQSYLDLPEGLNVESNADSMGVAGGNDVYIIADNIRILPDLKATVFHESLGHYGLEQLFGERLLQTMLDIYRTNNRMRADADAWLEENPDVYPESEFTQDERRALATEEVFAEMSESGQIMRDPKMRSAYNRVAALIRKFARALAQLANVDINKYKSLQYTNAEINDIIAQAHNKVISGKTRLVPRYNNIRYMKTRYNRIMTSAMGLAQNAPVAKRELLTGVIDALSNVPNSLRNAKLQTFSLHHIMQLFEKYAPAYRALNNLIERKAYDSTREMVEFAKQASKYREVLRNNSRFIDEFNKVAHLIHLSQAPVLEEQFNANGDFERFVPNVAAQRMRNIPENSAAYNALTPDEKVLHEAVNRFYALPTDVQQVIADIYTDYRNYSDNAFKIKLTQLMNRLPANIIAGIKANFQNNRLKFYLPLPREGMYKLVYLNNNGTRVSQLFDSMAGRDNAEKQVRSQGMTVLDEPKVLRQRNYGDSNLPPGLLKELLENVQNSLTSAGVAPADIDKAKETVFDTFIEFMPGAYGNDLRQEISSRKTFMLNGVMYYGRLGYDEDVIAAYEKRIPSIIYQINNLKYTMPFEKVRKLIKEQLNTYRDNKGAPAYAELPDLDDSYLESLREDLDSRITFAKSLQQYSPYVYAIGKANYIYSIALNISSALINTTILPMMAWPALAAKYGVVNASRAVGQAIQLFFKHSYRDPRTGRLSFDYKRLADMPASFGGNNMPAAYAQTAHGQEFNRFYRTLLARSVVGTAAEQELIQAENITVPGYEGLSAKANLLMSYVFRSSERMNREVSALAAYMLARNIDVNGQAFDPNRQGISVGKASEEAIRLNYDINGATTPETNSRLYQTDIGRIALTFRTHALNMILNLAFTFNQAIESINANQPNAAERKLLRSIALKKLLYIFGSTYMLAGIKGLPLFGAAEVLASLLMGDDDEPYDLEQKVLDSVGTLGLNGPVNELLNVDIASRTGFNGLLWRDDPKRLAEVGLPVYVLERLAGPTYGLVESARRGFNDLADGELVRASEALTPAPIRNMIKGMRYGIEGAQTRDGLPIVEDVNAYNSMMQILGFAPADLAVAQTQRGATYEVSEKLKNRRIALLTNLYAARKADNPEAMEKAFEDIRSFNESNPSYRITGDTITKSYKERERRAREAIMGVYQPRNLRIATSEYVTDLNAEDEDAFF